MTRARILLAALLLPAVAAAQLRPNADWHTLRTRHFAIHFTPELEPLARRAAVNAERAYGFLASELVAPRGTIDLVIADNVDFTNGYAIHVPTNRIVIYAHPPADETDLRDYDEWNALVIQHELTHIFHLDRTRGWWALAQHILGRAPGFFPNEYMPAWVTEGLAVYYESRFTGAGRLASAYHREIARAAATDRRLPSLGAVSLSQPRFPGGESVYIYGSLLLDFLAKENGAGHVRDFVERTSATAIPFLFLDHDVKRAFGMSLERAWTLWRDSLLVGADTARRLGAWRELTREGWLAGYPRWSDASTVYYSANTGRATTSAYEVDTAGHRERLGRRNGLTPTYRRPDGSLVFAQLDYVSPFDLRSDLYVSRGIIQHRLTHGARLFAPDARADGEIVAMQSVAGTTRLVRVSADGARITPITGTSLDVQWSEPRWSRAGTRIAAIKHTTDGRNSVVVLDSAGRELLAFATTRAVNATPSWAPRDTAILFASDRDGTSNIYVARLAPGGDGGAPVRLERLGSAGTAIFEPELSPNGALLAGSLLRGDGYHLGETPMATVPVTEARASADTSRPPYAAGASDDTARVSRYSPWHTLLPRYWLPTLGQSDAGIHSRGGTTIGVFTQGLDVVGRHAFTVKMSVDALRSAQLAYDFAYSYAGFGQPFLDADVTQLHDHFALVDSTGKRVLGELDRRKRIGTLAATFVRPRVRTGATFSVGGSYELRDFGTDPDPLFAQLPSVLQGRLEFPSLFATAGWSNLQRPTTSISPEDGIAVAATVRERWRRDLADSTRSTSLTTVLRGYKSLDLAGFAHHVLATRLAVGVADDRASSEFSVGGASGGFLELLPGYVVGQGARTFGVRGFAPGAQRGTRAVAATAEYRAPLSVIARGLPHLPVVLNRASIAVFGEGGRAWCPASVNDPGLCTPRTPNNDRTIASVGGELGVETALSYDVPYRLRAGFAVPVMGREFEQRSVSAYFLVGAAF